MLQNAVRISVDGYTVSINRLKINGYVNNLAVVLQMYRQILNVDAAFGIFVMDNDRCLVIGRSSSDGINVAGIIKNMGGGGHPGAIGSDCGPQHIRPLHRGVHLHGVSALKERSKGTCAKGPLAGAPDTCFLREPAPHCGHAHRP